MDARTFFDIMGTAPATVTVVTTTAPDGSPRGLTVAAVTSVSARPPSLLVSLDQRSRTLPDLLAAGRFAVNFLRGDRAETSRRFSAAVGDRFSGVAWRAGPNGLPILHDDSLAWLECEVEQVIESGDHVVVIASILDGAPPAAGSRPLMYFRHRYEAWPGDVEDGGAMALQERSTPGPSRAQPAPQGSPPVPRSETKTHP